MKILVPNRAENDQVIHIIKGITEDKPGNIGSDFSERTSFPTSPSSRTGVYLQTHVSCEICKQKKMIEPK